MFSNWSVTFAMALTTTTGRCGRRSLTICAARSMASASCTEVPPNFMTIMGDHPVRWHSPKKSLHLKQLGVQQGRPRRTADGVMGENCKLPVKHAAGTQAAHGRSHALSRINVETRLRTVRSTHVDHRLVGGKRKLHFLGKTAEIIPGCDYFFRLRFLP